MTGPRTETCRGCGQECQSVALPKGWIRVHAWGADRIMELTYCTIGCMLENVATQLGGGASRRRGYR